MLARIRLLCPPFVFEILAVILIAAAPGILAAQSFAADRPLSDEQMNKIESRIEAGAEVPLNKIVTDILGLTRDEETLSARAFAAKDPDNPAEIHEIGLLPGNAGYFDIHIHQDKIEVYWANADLVLVSAAVGARGGQAEQMSFREAQAGLAGEWTFWAKFADSN